MLKRYVIYMLICIFGVTPAAHAADEYTTIYNEVYSYNGNTAESDWIASAILYASDMYTVDPMLVTAVMETESHFSIDAISSAGAVGLMQLMPETAESIGVNPYDPLENITGGTAHLATLLNSFSSSGDLATNYAVAAYNAGSGAVVSYGGVPDYNETKQYIRTIYDTYMRLLAY